MLRLLILSQKTELPRVHEHQEKALLLYLAEIINLTCETEQRLQTVIHVLNILRGVLIALFTDTTSIIMQAGAEENHVSTPVISFETKSPPAWEHPLPVPPLHLIVFLSAP